MSGRKPNGQWLKGQSPNAGGLSRAQRRVVRLLEDMTPEAAKRLRELVHSTDEQVALGACREVFSRVCPPPPKTPSVAVSVAVNTNADHLAVLMAKAQARAARGPVIDLTPEPEAVTLSGHKAAA